MLLTYPMLERMDFMLSISAGDADEAGLVEFVSRVDSGEMYADQAYSSVSEGGAVGFGGEAYLQT